MNSVPGSPDQHSTATAPEAGGRATVAMVAAVATAAGLVTMLWPFDSAAAWWARTVSAALAVVAVALVFAWRRARAAPPVTAVATVVVLALGSLHWATHDDATPFEELYVLPALLVAAFARLPQTVLFFGALVVIQVLAGVETSPGEAEQAVTATNIVVVASLMALAHAWGRSARGRERALVSDRRRVEREMRRDPLTGLPNRRAFEEELQHAVRRAAAGGERVAVALLDLNGFKQINDRFGHLEGDRQLVDVARTMQRALRDKDVACRWAGDEFAILLRGVSLEQARETATRVDQHVRRTCATPDGRPVSVKWGVAAGKANAPAGEIMREADAALLRATRSRRPVPPLESGAPRRSR